RQLRSYFPPRDRPISAARLRIDGRIAKGGLVKRKGGSSPAPPRLARRRRQSQRLAAATRPCSFSRLMLAALGAGPRPALGSVALKRGQNRAVVALNCVVWRLRAEVLVAPRQDRLQRWTGANAKKRCNRAAAAMRRHGRGHEISGDQPCCPRSQGAL